MTEQMVGRGGSPRNGATATGDNGGAFAHPALVYDTVDEFLTSAVPYLLGALEDGTCAFAALGSDEVDALREELPEAPEIRLVDTRVWFPHPARRMRAFHALLSRTPQDAPPTTRLMGEPVWPAGPPEAVREWQRYESALNAALEPFPVSLMCTYPTARLDEAIVASAGRTHPSMVVDTAVGDSVDFERPERFLEYWNEPPPPPPTESWRIVGATDLASVRALVLSRALAAGVAADDAGNLSAAVNEAVTNSISHGEGPAMLSMWDEGGRFICQVDDEGPGIEDALAGYLPPDSGRGSGHGLWLARQLVDLLQIWRRPDGTTVRLHAVTTDR